MSYSKKRERGELDRSQEYNMYSAIILVYLKKYVFYFSLIQ